MPEMLNKKKERPAEWALALLGRCEYACLGLADEAQPYCVPVSHVLVDGCVYFHSNPRGCKAELLAQNPPCLPYGCGGCACHPHAFHNGIFLRHRLWYGAACA